ncbi:hypothetical protein SAMN04515672_1482 [Natronorubrum texcoconense]|uniref:Uncharacterized protein n=1 Tax=Natronorubrum texcoconense TaxID=1095776 RepID=A0A1G8WQX8_9EURY|nr:hypothetical protein SAMN04515672_1482 [Natronorubrum texcoconense]
MNELISGGLLVLCAFVAVTALNGVFEPNNELVDLARICAYLLAALVMIFVTPLTGVFALVVFELAFSSPLDTGETAFAIVVFCLVWLLVFGGRAERDQSAERSGR